MSELNNIVSVLKIKCAFVGATVSFESFESRAMGSADDEARDYPVDENAAEQVSL